MSYDVTTENNHLHHNPSKCFYHEIIISKKTTSYDVTIENKHLPKIFTSENNHLHHNPSKSY